MREVLSAPPKTLGPFCPFPLVCVPPDPFPSILPATSAGTPQWTFPARPGPAAAFHLASAVSEDDDPSAAAFATYEDEALYEDDDAGRAGDGEGDGGIGGGDDSRSGRQ